jgi:hypothetical protein
MPSEFKSWNGKQAEVEKAKIESEEDFFEFDGCSETAKTIGADIKRLDSVLATIPQAEQRLDVIVQQASSEILIGLYDKFKPDFELISKYSDRIPMGRKSLGRRIKAVKALEDRFNDAAQAISGRFYETFAVKKGGLDITGEIDRLCNIRQEMDGAAKSYDAVRKRFQSVTSRADIEQYLKKIPGMEKVRSELKEIEALLSTDQSKDNFTELKHKRKLVRFGFFDGKVILSYGFLAGRLMKDANRLDYKEGRMQCESIYGEIHDYIKNFDQLKKARAFIEDDTRKLEQKNSALQGYLNLQVADSSALNVIIAAHNDSHSNLESEFFRFNYLKQAKNDNDDARSRLDELRLSVAEKLYALAQQELESTAVPKAPESVDELKSVMASSGYSACRMKVLSGIFSVIGKDSETELCAEKCGDLTKFYAECRSQQNAVSSLEQQMSDLKLQLKEANGLFSSPAFIEHDFKKAVAILDAGAQNVPDYTPLKKSKEEYTALAGLVSRTVHERIMHGLGQLVELYSSPIQQTGDASADSQAVRSRLDKIKTFVMPFLAKDFAKKVPITTEKYVGQMGSAVQSYTAQLGSIEQACRQCDDIKRRITMMQTALEADDEKKIANYSRWPEEKEVNPYTAGAAKDYNRLLLRIHGASSEAEERKKSMKASVPKVPFSNSTLASKAFQSSPYDFFSNVAKMASPQHQRLKDLRTSLLLDGPEQRLSALESELAEIGGIAFRKDDQEWISALSRAYSSDLAHNANLSKISQCSPALKKKVDGIAAVFAKYRASA